MGGGDLPRVRRRRPGPAAYQDFKFAVIARLPDGDWVLTRAEVLDWLSAHAAEATGG